MAINTVCHTRRRSYPQEWTWRMKVCMWSLSSPSHPLPRDKPNTQPAYERKCASVSPPHLGGDLLWSRESCPKSRLFTGLPCNSDPSHMWKAKELYEWLSRCHSPLRIYRETSTWLVWEVKRTLLFHHHWEARWTVQVYRKNCMGLAWPAHCEDSEMCTFHGTGREERKEGNPYPTLGEKPPFMSMSALAQ